MAKEKIIVLDDEKSIGQLCKRVLVKEGYIVEIYSDGEKALDHISKEKVDLVLVDLKMPKIDGLSVLKRIKKISPDTDVIVMTGYTSIDSAVESIRLGAWDYIAKPFEIEDLKQKIKNCLQRRVLNSEVSELKEIVALYEVGQAMTSTLGLKQLLDLILKLACQVLKADSGSIMLLDGKHKQLKIESYFGLKREIVEGLRIGLGERIAGWVAATSQQLLLVDGLKNNPRFAHLETRPEIKSSMVVPLKIKDKVIGVINLNNYSENFTDKDLKLLTIFASNASLAISEACVYEKIKELDRLKTEFLSNTSHELRTPLMAIQGAIELLSNTLKKFSKKEIGNLIDIIQRNTKRMSELVKNLLDFSRIERGSFEIVKKKISVTTIIDEVVEEMKKIADKKRIKIFKNIPKKIPNILADPDRLKQVFINLVDNAIKFTPEGGKVTIGAKVSKSFIEFFVQDTGIGIAPDQKEKIFDKFYQVDGSLTREHGGLGLGLAIAKDIVELHSGNIWVESELKEGSKFIFTIAYK